MKNVWGLVKWVADRCEEHDIKLILYPADRTPGGDSGEFDPFKKRLIVATQDPDWLYVLAHEAGHLQQWLTNHPTWYPHRDDFRTLDLWMTRKKNFSAQEFLHAVRRIQKCEHYAEKFAIRELRAIGYPVERVIKIANFGLWRFEHMRRTRNWIDQTEERLGRMPCRLISIKEMRNLPADWI